MINLKQNIVKEGVRTKKQAAVNKVSAHADNMMSVQNKCGMR